MPDFRTIVADRTRPLDERIDAVEKLSRESGEYNELWKYLFPVVDSENEDSALRSAALAALSYRNSAAPVQLLVRPFEDQSVRRAAIEILEKLAPVSGEQEVLLNSELSAMHGTLAEPEIDGLPLSGTWKGILSAQIKRLRGPDREVNRSCMVINLAQRWGRDHRVLSFLNEELRQPDPLRRRDAVFGLCMLGELQPTLDAANDSSPIVRSVLASRLGYYREVQGIDVLKRLLGDNDAEVSKEAKTALRLLNQLEMPQTIEQPLRTSTWGQLLTEISRVQLADRNIASGLPDHKLTEGWLGQPGAAETEITSAEERLGVRLPPSYRSFLAESNGFDHIGPFIYKVYSAAEIDWFRVRNQDWIDAYQNGDDISCEEHLAEPENCVRFRTAYLSSCLQVSEQGDSAVVLMNPEVVSDEGEWETWFFANWNPGATRYPSFRAYVESELESLNSLR